MQTCAQRNCLSPYCQQNDVHSYMFWVMDLLLWILLNAVWIPLFEFDGQRVDHRLQGAFINIEQFVLGWLDDLQWFGTKKLSCGGFHWHQKWKWSFRMLRIYLLDLSRKATDLNRMHLSTIEKYQLAQSLETQNCNHTCSRQDRKLLLCWNIFNFRCHGRTYHNI